MNFVAQLEDYLRDLGSEARKKHPGMFALMVWASCCNDSATGDLSLVVACVYIMVLLDPPSCSYRTKLLLTSNDLTQT